MADHDRDAAQRRDDTDMRSLTMPHDEVAAMSELQTTAAGAVSLVVGIALGAAPARSAAALGLVIPPTRARALGALDVVLGTGLLTGRPRWPWMAARAVVNAGLVRLYRASSHTRGGDRRAQRGASTMALLTVVDGAAAMVLRRSRR